MNIIEAFRKSEKVRHKTWDKSKWLIAFDLLHGNIVDNIMVPTITSKEFIDDNWEPFVELKKNMSILDAIKCKKFARPSWPEESHCILAPMYVVFVIKTGPYSDKRMAWAPSMEDFEANDFMELD